MDYQAYFMKIHNLTWLDEEESVCPPWILRDVDTSRWQMNQGRVHHSTNGIVVLLACPVGGL